MSSVLSEIIMGFLKKKQKTKNIFWHLIHQNSLVTNENNCNCNPNSYCYVVVSSQVNVTNRVETAD